MKDLLEKLTEKDWYTWVGHGVQGFIFCFVLGMWNVFFAVGFVFGAFLHREISDLLKHWALKDKSPKQYLEDGWMDFVVPVIAMAPALALLALLGFL